MMNVTNFQKQLEYQEKLYTLESATMQKIDRLKIKNQKRFVHLMLRAVSMPGQMSYCNHSMEVSKYFLSV